MSGSSIQIPLIIMFVLIPVSCIPLSYDLKSEMVILLEVLLFYRIVLVILGFYFSTLSIILSRSVKNFIVILMGISLNL